MQFVLFAVNAFHYCCFYQLFYSWIISVLPPPTRPLTMVFPPNISWFSAQFHFGTCSGRKPLEISGMGYYITGAIFVAHPAV